MIPYSAEVFFAILAEYNQFIWPAQVVALILARLALWAVSRPLPSLQWVPFGVLVASWLWIAGLYFLHEFSEIDFWAYGFAAAFVVQAMLIAWAGLVRGSLVLRLEPERAEWPGIGLTALGFAGYSLLAIALGRELGEVGYFGVSPAPTVLFTLGLFASLRSQVPVYVFAIPLLWCVIGSAAALHLSIYEDLVLVPAAVIAIAVRVIRARRKSIQPTSH